MTISNPLSNSISQWSKVLLVLGILSLFIGSASATETLFTHNGIENATSYWNTPDYLNNIAASGIFNIELFPYETFVLDTTTNITKATFYVAHLGDNPNGNMYAKIYNVDGGGLGNYAPCIADYNYICSESPLATSDAVAISTLTSSFTAVNFTFSTPYQLNSSTRYAIVYVSTEVATDYEVDITRVQLDFCGTDPYTTCNDYSGNSGEYNWDNSWQWFGMDMIFYLYTTDEQSSPPDTSFTVSLPVGYTEMFFNSSIKTQSDINASGQNLTTAFIRITNTGNVAQNFTWTLNASSPTNATLKVKTDNSSSGATNITTTPVQIITSLATSSYADVWHWVDYLNAAPMTIQRILTMDS